MKRAIGALVIAAGLVAASGLRRAPRASEAPAAPQLLVLSDQARRFLSLQYRSFPTELMGA